MPLTLEKEERRRETGLSCGCAGDAHAKREQLVRRPLGEVALEINARIEDDDRAERDGATKPWGAAQV